MNILSSRYLLDHGANPEAQTEEGETVMDLVEEEDLEKMALIFGAMEEVGSGGEKRVERMEGNERIEKSEDVGIGEIGIENGTPGVKVGWVSEGRSGEGRTPEFNVDLAKKVTKSLEVTECNVDSKKGKQGEILYGVGRKNSEGEVVEKEEKSLRGKRMPAWVRRESIQWESSQREIFGGQESLVRKEKKPPEKDFTSKEGAELVEVKSQNESLQSESFEEERGSEEPQSEETKEKREEIGGGEKGDEVTKATSLVWNEEEKEELDFCKVEEKLSEWRRRRKSGREEEEDRVR